MQTHSHTEWGEDGWIGVRGLDAYCGLAYHSLTPPGQLLAHATRSLALQLARTSQLAVGYWTVFDAGLTTSNTV